MQGKTTGGFTDPAPGLPERRLIAEVDDGRGVDLKKVAKVLSQAEPGAHSAEELAQAIFQPGFSTSDTVNRLSGQGMGPSVVYETVHRLQGNVTLRI